MNDMINKGTAANALEADEEDDVEQWGGKEEGQEEYDEEDKNGGTRGPKWKPLEDRCLYNAGKEMSIDSVIGAKQKSDAYRKRIKTEFDKCKSVDPDYAVMFMTTPVSRRL
jgi:hypothetical protein